MSFLKKPSENEMREIMAHCSLGLIHMENNGVVTSRTEPCEVTIKKIVDSTPDALKCYKCYVEILARDFMAAQIKQTKRQLRGQK